MVNRFGSRMKPLNAVSVIFEKGGLVFIGRFWHAKSVDLLGGGELRSDL